jgi:hypothetical protein
MGSIELAIGLWQGTFQNIDRLWLRWYDAQGSLIPTPAEKERTKAERLAAKLRELGVNPEDL